MIDVVLIVVFWIVLFCLLIKLLLNLFFPYYVLFSAKHSNPDGSRGESPLPLIEWILYGALIAVDSMVPDMPISIGVGKLSWLCPLIIVATYLHFFAVIMIGFALRNRLQR